MSVWNHLLNFLTLDKGPYMRQSVVQLTFVLASLFLHHLALLYKAVMNGGCYAAKRHV